MGTRGGPSAGVGGRREQDPPEQTLTRWNRSPAKWRLRPRSGRRRPCRLPARGRSPIRHTPRRWWPPARRDSRCLDRGLMPGIGEQLLLPITESARTFEFGDANSDTQQMAVIVSRECKDTNRDGMALRFLRRTKLRAIAHAVAVASSACARARIGRRGCKLARRTPRLRDPLRNLRGGLWARHGGQASLEGGRRGREAGGRRRERRRHR